MPRARGGLARCIARSVGKVRSVSFLLHRIGHARSVTPGARLRLPPGFPGRISPCRHPELVSGSILPDCATACWGRNGRWKRSCACITKFSMTMENQSETYGKYDDPDAPLGSCASSPARRARLSSMVCARSAIARHDASERSARSRTFSKVASRASRADSSARSI